MKHSNIERSRNLRKNQTDAEKKLWSIIRNRQLSGAKFKRQFSKDKYILDFYCPEYKLCIEADGGQHYADEGKQKDEARTSALHNLGVEVIRFTDQEILTNIDGVYEIIQKAIERKKENAPSPHPSPHGGEGENRGRANHR